MLANARPFAAIAELQAASDKLWLQLQRTDWDEAFASHPPIGVTKTAPGATSQSARWSSEEQGGMPGVDAEVVQRLAEHNALYEQRFGRTFIVCATGKTAEQMLAILQLRLDSSEEQGVARGSRTTKTDYAATSDEMAATVSGVSTHIP